MTFLIGMQRPEFQSLVFCSEAVVILTRFVSGQKVCPTNVISNWDAAEPEILDLETIEVRFS